MRSCDAGVCKTGFQSTASGGGEPFLLLDCRAAARAKGVPFLAGTGMGSFRCRVTRRLAGPAGDCADSAAVNPEGGRARDKRRCSGNTEGCPHNVSGAGAQASFAHAHAHVQQEDERLVS